MDGLRPIMQEGFRSIGQKVLNLDAISIDKLGELKAKKELRGILEHCKSFVFKLWAATALARLGDRDYLVAQLKKAKADKEKEGGDWAFPLSKVLIKNGFAKEAWQVMSDGGIKGLDCHHLFREIFEPLLKLGIEGKVDLADPVFKDFETLFVDVLQEIFEFRGFNGGEIDDLDRIGSLRPDLIQKALARVEDEENLKSFDKRDAFLYTITLLFDRGLIDEEKAHNLIGICGHQVHASHFEIAPNKGMCY